MIVFIDPFNRGLSHVPVNAGVIETALAAHPGRRLTVIAERDHLRGLEELVDRDIWNSATLIPIEPPHPGGGFMGRLAVDYRNLNLGFTNSLGNALLVLADLAPATLYALRLNYLRRPLAFQQILAVLHGNASELAGWRARNPFVRAKQLQPAMAMAPGNTRFVVLEDSIRRALIEVVPAFREKLATLPHPLPTIEGSSHGIGMRNAERERGLDRQPIRIAFLGAAQSKKGFDGFLDLARSLSGRFPERVEFHAIGWLPPESAGLDLSCLARPPSRNKIDRHEFLEALQSVDYVCMPYSQELYRYSASGTLLDAASTGKPILALRSPLLEDLQTGFGDIGELADDLGQLELLTAGLVSAHDSQRYRLQSLAMEKICESRMPRNLVPQWKALCDLARS